MAPANLGPQMLAALESEEPVDSLRDVVRGMIDRGRARKEVVGCLTQLREELHKAGRDADEDAVLDVLDFVTGWASPHMKL